MSKFDRRHFIFSSASLAGSSLFGSLMPLLSSLANAQTEERGKHFFVLIHGNGAMDVTCGLDPQIPARGITEKDLFLDKEYKISRSKGVALANGASELLSYADDIAIVNGVVMASDRSDPGHETATKYIISGRPDGTSLPLSSEIGVGLGESPFGTLLFKPSAFSQIDLRSYPKLPIMDLVNLVQQGLGTENANYGAINPDAAGIAFASMINANSNYGSTLASYAAAAPYQKRFAQELISIQQKGDGQLPAEISGTAAAFILGTSTTALIIPDNSTGGSFDTHSGHAINHLNAQKNFFSYVKQFISTFKALPYGEKGKSLFDHTTFMVTSEFSRTPGLNGNQGKDHNAETNSVLLMGKGIQGGQVVGSSFIIPRGQDRISRHVGSPFDFSKSRVVDFSASKREIEEQHKKSKVIRPENIAVTLRHAFRIPAASFNPSFSEVSPITALIKKR